MMQKKRHAIERTPCKIFRGGGEKKAHNKQSFKIKERGYKKYEEQSGTKKTKIKKDRAAGMCICIKSCGNGALYGIAVLRCCAIQK